MVRKLFELNIPEIENGNIEIMGIARDPGNRTKVGVMSMSPNIDAKGSCVGPQGSRIKEINNIINFKMFNLISFINFQKKIKLNFMFKKNKKNASSQRRQPRNKKLL